MATTTVIGCQAEATPAYGVANDCKGISVRESDKLVTPSREVHFWTFAAGLITFLGSGWRWPDLFKDAVQTFGTVGLFLTAYGVLFSIIEVLRTQSVTIAAGNAAREAADLAQTPFDMRDVSDCMAKIDNANQSIGNGANPWMPFTGAWSRRA